MQVRTERLVVAFTALFLAASPGAAQGFDIGLTPSECDDVVANALSNPANLDTLRLVRHCPGEFGPVMAELLGRTALPSTDYATYKEIVALSVNFIEDDIFDAARDLVQDGSAPYLARIAGLSILNSYTSPTGIFPQLDFFVSYTGPSTGCGGGGWGATVVSFPGEEPLSSNATAQALSSARYIIGNATEPGLKFLASCIQARHDLSGVGFSPEPAEFTPSTDFSYVKQCGRKFLIRNASNAWVSMTLNLAPSSPPGPHIVKQWTAPPRPEGASYSESTWTAPGAGTAWIKQIPPLSPHLMAPTAVDTTPC